MWVLFYTTKTQKAQFEENLFTTKYKKHSLKRIFTTKAQKAQIEEKFLPQKHEGHRLKGI